MDGSVDPPSSRHAPEGVPATARDAPAGAHDTPGGAGGAVDGSAGDARDALADAIDGSTGDWSVSGDAMRWSPDLADRGPVTALPGPLAGLDVAAGLGSVLGLDGAGMRRLVSGALNSLTVAASDVAGELRELVRPREPRPDEEPPAG